MSIPHSISDIYNKLKGHKYGGLYHLMHPILMIRDPELIKMVTMKDFDHFLNRQDMIDNDAEPIFGKALLNLKGEQLSVCTVLLLPLNRHNTDSRTQWLNGE
jgi:cytochrome P450 family 9